MLEILMTLFNFIIITLFHLLYKECRFETVEDRFHKNQNHNQTKWNNVKMAFKKNDEYTTVRDKLLDVIHSPEILHKYNITTESILDKTNDVFSVSFHENNCCIYMHFNHYHLSGSNMLYFLNKIVNNDPHPVFLHTNPCLGITNMPLYLYELLSITKKEYVKLEETKEELVIEKNITTHNKRYCSYLHILQQVYRSLQMNRPMVVAISVGFHDLPYITNNVGLIIFHYEPTDTIETLENKIKKAYYQAYCSNFIINCPLPDIGYTEIRDYVDCIISSMYIKSDYDVTIAWNCNKPPTEQVYVGSVSIIRSDGTMDLNMCINTCSSHYKYLRIENSQTHTYVKDFFADLT